MDLGLVSFTASSGRSYIVEVRKVDSQNRPFTNFEVGKLPLYAGFVVTGLLKKQESSFTHVFACAVCETRRTRRGFKTKRDAQEALQKFFI